jgi:hypothetical protein
MQHSRTHKPSAQSHHSSRPFFAKGSQGQESEPFFTKPRSTPAVMVQPQREVGESEELEEVQAKAVDSDLDSLQLANDEPPLPPTEPPPAEANGNSIIQTKLTIGQPNDRYEQEADRVAEQVMRMSEPTVQRQREYEEKATDSQQFIQPQPISEQITPLTQPQTSLKDTLQMKAEKTQISGKQADLSSQIQSAKGRGSPLSKSTRQFFEPRFGTDLKNVKIHTDNESDQLNQALQARAFTVGQDIFFKQGEYAPHHQRGQRLLAHELTHVIQQANTIFSSSPPYLQKSGKSSKKLKLFVTLTPDFLGQLDQWDEERTKQEYNILLFQQYGFSKDRETAINDIQESGIIFTSWNGITSKEIEEKKSECSFPEDLFYQLSGLPAPASQLTPEEIAERKHLKFGIPYQERQSFFREATRRGRKITGRDQFPEGEKKPGQGDYDLRMSLFYQVVKEKQQLDTLPQNIKDLLKEFSNGAKPIKPKDYPDLLELAWTLQSLSSKQLEALRMLVKPGSTDASRQPQILLDLIKQIKNLSPEQLAELKSLEGDNSPGPIDLKKGHPRGEEGGEEGGFIRFKPEAKLILKPSPKEIGGQYVQGSNIQFQVYFTGSDPYNIILNHLPSRANFDWTIFHQDKPYDSGPVLEGLGRI